jgi:DNA-binding PadR family transcriptional regulator
VVGREAVDDRRLQLLFAFGAGEDGEARDGDKGAAERLRVWIFEHPGGVELVVRRQAGLPRERLEGSGLREVWVGWRIRRARGKEGPCEVLHRFEVAALVRAPDLDHDRCARLGDAACFAQGGDHVVGEEEGVEARDEVERLGLPGEIFHLADAEIRVGQPPTGELDQRVRGVDAVRFTASLGNQTWEGAGAAADVEHAPARLEPRSLQRWTRERTVYTLTDKGRQALADYARTPVTVTPLKSEPLLRLLICDLVGEDVTRESLASLRTDIAELRRRLDDSERSAEGLPHREKYLQLVVDFLRGLLDLHEQLVNDVERAFPASRRKESSPGNRKARRT